MHDARINFNFTARYYQTGQITDQTTDILFVLHGHGQLAGYFLKKFDVLNHSALCIYAPEGLSHYYLQGLNGRVGATWMTREDRENDISNYISYLNAIYQKESPLWPRNARIHVLGFSQGATTATRWVLNGLIHPARLILWAGILPYDMDITHGKEVMQDIEAICVYGERDPFLTKEKQLEMTDLASHINADFQYITFPGKHELDNETLKKIFPIQT